MIMRERDGRWCGRPPTASMCQDEVVRSHQREPSMATIARLGIDTSKSLFQLHGVDEREEAVLRKQVRRGQFLAFIANGDRPGGVWRLAPLGAPAAGVGP